MRKSLFFVTVIWILSSIPAFAEVVLDGTMGTAGKINGPVYEIQQNYGARAGSNLFHSFDKFNINTGEKANFMVSPDIQNIISRVTGGKSWIDGTLSSTISGSSDISGANLFLLNPAGVMFGKNAALDLDGSFHISTAHYLRMGENERFYANAESNVLSSAAPSAFGFLDTAFIEKITFYGKTNAGLEVSEGETLSVVSGGIEMTTETIESPEGRINLVSVGSAGEVVLTQTGVDTASFNTMGDIQLSNGSLITTSSIKAGTEGSGDIFIRAGKFYLENSSLESDTKDDGIGGIINIQAQTLMLKSGTLFSDTEGTGIGGDIVIASDMIEVSEGSEIFADSTEQGAQTGSAGSVSIFAKQISLSESEISSETYGKSRGGNVTICADEFINTDKSSIFARSTGYKADSDAGESGEILIESNRITLQRDSMVTSDTYEDGDAGIITISGKSGGFAESIDVIDSRIFAGTTGTYVDSGDGGIVTLRAKNISFENNGEIGSESFGGGQGGDVVIQSSESLKLYGKNNTGESSVIHTASKGEDSYAGTAGSISIKAQSIFFKDSGGINASTIGPGNAGDIVIEADNIQLENSAFISSASTSTNDGGDAGTITLTANNEINLSGNSAITTEAEDAGKGKITINVNGKLYAFNSKVITSIKGGGEDAGDININWETGNPEFVILNSSKIVANAWAGRGGNIHIVSEQFIQSMDSIVDASSHLGIDGTVNIESPDTDVSSGLTVLPSSLLDATQWVKTPCALRTGESVSRFVLRGKDAVPRLNDIQAAKLLWIEE